MRRNLLIICLLLAAPGGAAQQGGEQPINIEADRANFSQKTATSTYTGNVVLIQGTLTLTGSKLVIERDNDNQSLRAQLTGSPATLHREADADTQQPVDGRAQRMFYDAAAQQLSLRGDALINRGGDTIRGASIEHDLASSRTRATGAEGGERVRITIQPETAGQAQPNADADSVSEPQQPAGTDADQ